LYPIRRYITTMKGSTFERKQCSVVHGLDLSRSESTYWSNARLIRSLTKPSQEKERKWCSLSDELITDSRIVKGGYVFPAN
jgi:hypothetical protein